MLKTHDTRFQNFKKNLIRYNWKVMCYIFKCIYTQYIIFYFSLSFLPLSILFSLSPSLLLFSTLPPSPSLSLISVNSQIWLRSNSFYLLCVKQVNISKMCIIVLRIGKFWSLEPILVNIWAILNNRYILSLPFLFSIILLRLLA